MDNVLNTVQRLKQIETTQKMYSTRAKQVLRNNPRFNFDALQATNRLTALPADLQDNIELRKDISEMMDKFDKFELKKNNLYNEYIDAVSARQHAFEDGETDLSVYERQVEDSQKIYDKEKLKTNKIKDIMQPYLDEFRQMN